jgi:hypothetical protein
MSELSTPHHYFTWQRFTWIVLGQVVIFGALEIFWYTRGTTWITASLGALALIAWINLSFAITWRDLMRQERSGELSLNQYRANPQTYLRGSKLHQRIRFWGAIVVVVLYGVLSVFL